MYFVTLFGNEDVFSREKNGLSGLTHFLGHWVHNQVLESLTLIPSSVPVTVTGLLNTPTCECLLHTGK